MTKLLRTQPRPSRAGCRYSSTRSVSPRVRGAPPSGLKISRAPSSHVIDEVGSATSVAEPSAAGARPPLARISSSAAMQQATPTKNDPDGHNHPMATKSNRDEVPPLITKPLSEILRLPVGEVT